MKVIDKAVGAKRRQATGENQKGQDAPPIRIYMAGSMAPDDGWRQLGITARERGICAMYASRQAWGDAEYKFLRHTPEGRPREFIYCGPFPTSCDHGCAHGTGHLAFSCNGDSRKDLLAACYHAVESCDIFAAYINREDLFGTFAEIGMARAMGKKIWIGFNPKALNYKKIGFDSVDVRMTRHDHDMWFLAGMADGLCSVQYCEKPIAAVRFFQWASLQRIGGNPE